MGLESKELKEEPPQLPLMEGQVAVVVTAVVFQVAQVLLVKDMLEAMVCQMVLLLRMLVVVAVEQVVPEQQQLLAVAAPAAQEHQIVFQGQQ